MRLRHMRVQEGLSASLSVAMLMVALSGTDPVDGAGIDTVPSTWEESPDLVAEVTNGTDWVRIDFAAAPQPPEWVPRVAYVYPDYGEVGSPFVGDYLDAGAMMLRFDVESDGRQPNKKYIFLRGASGREWQRDIDVPDSGGGTAENLVPLDWTEWSPGTSVDGDDWVEDLADVAELGIYLRQGGADAYKNQYYTVSNFRLVGNDGVAGAPAELTATQRHGLLTQFGVLDFGNVSAEQKSRDTDKDGMSDYHEIIVETAWDSASDRFIAELEHGADRVMIKWRCSQGGVYNVLRASRVGGEYLPVLVESQLDLTPTEAEIQTGYMRRIVAAPGQGPHFYRVRKKQP